MDHRDGGAKLLERMIQELSHIGQVERAPMFEGRLMTMFMAPTAQKGQTTTTTKKKKKKEEPSVSSDSGDSDKEKTNGEA